METVVSLLFLDWLGRSPMAREICAPKSALRVLTLILLCTSYYSSLHLTIASTLSLKSNLLFFILLQCEPEDSDADIKSEEEQTREQQKAALWRRIEMVKSSIENLSLASLKCK